MMIKDGFIGIMKGMTDSKMHMNEEEGLGELRERW